MLHHGTADPSVPIEWSRQTVQILQELEKTVIFHEYAGEPHEFTVRWPLVMKRTTEFFDEHIKGYRAPQL